MGVVAFVTSLILLAAVVGLGLVAILRDPNVCRASRRVRRPFYFPFVRPLARNLPGDLLDARLNHYRIDGIEPVSGLPRTYLVDAKHAGAALEKARGWGLKVRSVRRTFA